MSSWARVGVVCVCVGRKRKVGEPKRINDMGYRKMPSRGQAYTITRTFQAPVLGELHTFISISGFPYDHGFHVDGFRPTFKAEGEDDISMFKSLLKPTEVPA